MNKTLLIVCVVIVVLAISVPTTILVMQKVNENNSTDTKFSMGNMPSSITEDMTFEEYSKDFKDDVTEEQIAEAEEIFNQLQEAMADDDTETKRSLMMQLNQLGLFETDGQMADQGQRPEGAPAGDGSGQRPGK